jgi:outer membrane protein
MSYRFLCLLLAVALCPAALLAQAAPAAAPAAPTVALATGPTHVGIISIQDAIVATNEGQRDFDAMGKKFEPRRNELKSLSDEIEGLKKQLNTQGDKMNDDARATLVKSIEQKQKALTRSSEDAQNEFQGQQNEIAQRILQKMGPVIDKYAKENSLGLILDASRPWPEGQVLWANEGVNITKAIVDAYNAQSGVAAPPAAAPKPAAAAPKPAAARPAAPKPATTTTTPPKPN